VAVPVSSRFLARQALKTKTDSDGITVTVPSQAPDAIASVIAIEYQE